MVPRNSSKASPISSIDVVLKHHVTVLRTDVLFPSVPFFMRLQGTYDSVQSFWELRGGGGNKSILGQHRPHETNSPASWGRE